MKEKINIIHDKETEMFFRKIGLFEKILNKEIKCVCCQDSITAENFRGVFRKNDNLFLFCNKKGCSSFIMTEKLEEGNNG